MWLWSGLVALVLAGPNDTPPAPAPAAPGVEAEEGPGPEGRFLFLWFLGPKGLFLDFIIEQGPAGGERPPVIFCGQVHVGVTPWVGIRGDWTLERPLMVRLPNRGIGPTFWIGTTPTFWRLLGEALEPPADEDGDP